MDDQPRQTLNTHIREYFTAAEKPGSTASWLSRREIPTSAEILRVSNSSDQTSDSRSNIATEKVELPVNKIFGKWRSKEDYLMAHYELVKEDVLGPFIEAVDSVRNNIPGKENEAYCVYDKVYIKGFTFSQQGIAARVQFSYKRAGKKIIWEQSKRLITGSLIALSPATDGFQTTCVVAVVAARPLDGVKQTPPEIDIFFATPEEIHIDPQQEWVMVESKTGYFEAARHVLVALQKLMQESFPLSEHFIRLRRNIAPPMYLQNNPHVNLSAACPDEAGNANCTSITNVDLLNDWPKSPGKHLDTSQWSALQQILTKRLSIIQGPPGTGKTHVSVIALRVLLENMKPGDPPIIVAAQTNHALDQLLLHISHFEDNFVRLGGRSTDTGIIKNRTIYEVRRASPSGRDPPGCLKGPAFNKQRHLTKEFATMLYPFQNHQEPLPATMFRDLNLLTDTQYKSLVCGAEQFVRLGDDQTKQSPIALWLGDALGSFCVTYDSDNFGFEDEEEQDLEFEQLKELEAEQGLTDDDGYDILRGTYLNIAEPFTARKSTLLLTKTIEKLSAYKDMWKIPTQARGGIYRHLQGRAKELILVEFRNKAKAYSTATRKLQVGKWEKDATILEGTKLIGMTTTGFSKNRPLISSLKPRIVLIEEAAEIVEAPVTVTCVESLQHLILVGDHKQLQGHCSQKELEGDPFYLDVSMFERLVNNNLPYKSLSKQRRMNPEIRRLLTPIYGELEDHDVVKSREDIPGMGGVNSFFFCHSWTETTDDHMSKCNIDEAEMIAQFFSYLFLNGTRVNQITVLTFYNGQRKKILQKLRQQRHITGCYFKVVTVDSYQGEENDVVLLSLVRSNSRRNIGFLSVENRVCVALSRAKRGFYIFGNAENLCHSNRLWWEVLKIMAESPRRVGFSLPLVCANHARKSWIQHHTQWNDLAGGCDRRCHENMTCGHQCPMNCHVFSHNNVECPAPCKRTVPCNYNHSCIEKCHVRPCRCQCFSQGQDYQSTVNGFQHLQILSSQDAYDGPATPQASLPAHDVRHNHAPQQAQRINEDYSPRQNNLRNEGYSPSQSTPHQVRKPRSPFRQPQDGEREILKAWGAYANGGHLEDDARLYKEAERLYNVQKQEWLQQQQQHQTMANAENQVLFQGSGDESRTLSPDSIGGETILDGFLPVAEATANWKNKGKPAINLMD